MFQKQSVGVVRALGIAVLVLATAGCQGLLNESPDDVEVQHSEEVLEAYRENLYSLVYYGHPSGELHVSAAPADNPFAEGFHDMDLRDEEGNPLVFAELPVESQQALVQSLVDLQIDTIRERTAPRDMAYYAWRNDSMREFFRRSPDRAFDSRNPAAVAEMHAVMEERMPSLERYVAAYEAEHSSVVETAALSEAQKFSIIRGAHRQGRIILHRPGHGSGSSGTVPTSFAAFWFDFGHASIMSESSPPAGHHNILNITAWGVGSMAPWGYTIVNGVNRPPNDNVQYEPAEFWINTPQKADILKVGRVTSVVTRRFLGIPIAWRQVWTEANGTDHTRAANWARAQLGKPYGFAINNSAFVCSVLVFRSWHQGVGINMVPIGLGWVFPIDLYNSASTRVAASW